MKSTEHSMGHGESEADWLEAALFAAVPPQVADDGFSRSVMEKLVLAPPKPTVAGLRLQLHRQQIRCLRQDAMLGLACLLGMVISLMGLGWPSMEELNEAASMLLYWPATSWRQVLPLSAFVVASWVLTGTLYWQLTQNRCQYA